MTLYTYVLATSDRLVQLIVAGCDQIIPMTSSYIGIPTPKETVHLSA